MKRRLTGATFDASAQTIVHTSFSDVGLAGIQLITNVTDDIVIYNFADPAKGGSLSTDTLTLTYDTTSMSDADDLMILVEDGAASVAINDGGNTITVDGTVTANLSATDNTVLDNIDTSTAAAATSLAALDNSVDGNYLNTNMNIAGTDVDGNSGNKSAQTLRVVLATDQPALTNKLLVTPDLPSGASTLAEQQTQTTHLATIAGDTTDIEAAVELIDDTIFVDDAAFTPATSKVQSIGFIVDDTGTDSVDEGDIGAPRMSADRVPYMQGAVASAATDSGNPVKVGGKYNSTRPTFTDGQRGDLQLDSRGNVGVILYNGGTPSSFGADNADAVAVSSTADKQRIISRNTVYNSATSQWDRMKGDSTDGLLVNLGSNNDVTVTGTVTANLSATDNTAIDLIGSNQTDGSQKTQIVDAGGEAVTVTGGKLDVNATASLAGETLPVSGATEAVAVAIVDDSGDQISSFGGGTQYTEGDTDASITGTAMLWEDGSDTLRAVSAAKPLPVDIQDASVAVTQGTAANLNMTEASGATIATNTGNAATSLAIVDDWDATAGSAHPNDGVMAMGSDGTNARRIKTDASGELQVDVLTMPSTAVTNAGTFAVQVDGSALTALQLIDDTVATLGTTTYTETSTKGNVIGAVRRDADTTLVDTTNEIGPLQMDANGRLKVEAFSGETLPVSLTSTTITGTVSVQSNSANLATQTTVAAIQTAVELIDDPVATDDTTTHSTGTTKVMGIGAVATPTDASVNANDIGMPAMTTDRKLHVAVMDALPAGTAAIGKLAANSGVDIGDVDVTSIAAGTNAIGNVGLIGRTSGGLSMFRSLDIDETEEDIKTSAGQLFGITAFNRTAAPLYLKFYNATAANVTVGSTTPVLTFVVPGNADSDGAGFIWNSDIGLAFGTAISVACTTGVADADTGAPGANDCVINCFYM